MDENVSIFQCPYRCSLSAGLEANVIPTIPTTLDAPSKKEWNPSVSMLKELEYHPYRTLARATAMLSIKIITRILLTVR